MVEKTQSIFADSFQIAWDYLEATGELGSPDMAAGHLLDPIEAMIRLGERRRLVLSNHAIIAYERFRAEQTRRVRRNTEFPSALMLREDAAMDSLTKRSQPDRSKINMSEDFEVKYWTKALGVDREMLSRAVDKVGNSAAAVRKELGILGRRH